MSDLKENIRLAVAISKGIIRDQRSRRTVLFFVISAAVLMVFAGAVLLEGWLAANPWIFIAYWGACIWLTFLSFLLAVHDLLMLRREARRERQRLKGSVFGMKDHDPHA
jgi:hypothetical protein